MSGPRGARLSSSASLKAPSISWYPSYSSSAISWTPVGDWSVIALLPSCAVALRRKTSRRVSVGIHSVDLLEVRDRGKRRLAVRASAGLAFVAGYRLERVEDDVLEQLAERDPRSGE